MKVAHYGTTIVVLHAIAHGLHGLAHITIPVVLSLLQSVFISVVIFLIPIIAAVLLWTPFDRMGSVMSDEALEAYIRETCGTVFHPIGTCKMGTDPMAVVDSELRVYGVEGLRVVDASIMPTPITGHTNAPTIMIGEKAADLIKATGRIAQPAPSIAA